MSSYQRRQHARERARRLARRRTQPRRNQRGSASGIYAGVLLVLLVLVLLFMRNYSGRVAKAFVDATEPSSSQHVQNLQLTTQPIDAMQIQTVRRHQWQTIYHGQLITIYYLDNAEANNNT